VKFWPTKRWKKIVLTVLLVVLAVFAGLGAYLEYSVYREVTVTETLNPSGSKIALVIYHSGLTSFTKDVASAYVDGLVSTGWQVELTSASKQAPSDLSKYSLMVLCWPIYDLNPAPTITNYLQRVGDLNGLNTTIITVGGGLDPLNAPAAMNKIVQDTHGSIIQSLTMYRSNRNMTQLTEQASIIKP
jgi:flavorubredoxin